MSSKTSQQKQQKGDEQKQQQQKQKQPKQEQKDQEYGSQTSRQSSQQSSRRGSQQPSHDGSDRGSTSPRKQKDPNKGRHNKIYHTPPTPPPLELYAKEKSFVLDNIACGSISTDYSKANPKLGPVIPPYNSHRDRHVRAYFKFIGVDRTLRNTEQERPGTSIDGPVMDRFFTDGAGFRYLRTRNQFGAGHSPETTDGHAQFMQNVKPVIGYNGKFGYRRTTPWLRAEPSPFGTASDSPTH